MKAEGAADDPICPSAIFPIVSQRCQDTGFCRRAGKNLDDHPNLLPLHGGEAFHRKYQGQNEFDLLDRYSQTITSFRRTFSWLPAKIFDILTYFGLYKFAQGIGTDRVQIASAV